MILIISAFLASFIVSFFSIPSLIKIAKEKHLYDEPDTTRKKHFQKIPTLGGIAIFSGTLISFTFFADLNQIPEIGYILSAVIILFFTGVKDDIIPLVVWKKMTAQIAATAIIVSKGNIVLVGFYGIFGIQDLPYLLQTGLSFFTILIIINSFNLLDGINGIAGAISLLVCIIFSFLFFNLNQYNWAILSASTSGGTLAFLYFNFRKKASIFMGDTGSLTIGIVSAILSIEFINLASTNPQFGYISDFYPILTFSILIIPLFDTLRVFAIRILNKKSPFSGDRNHLHHFLLDIGCNHLQATTILVLLNIFLVVLTFSLYKFPLLALSLILTICFLFSILLSWLRRNKQKRVAFNAFTP